MVTILAYTVSTLIGKEIVTSAIRETANSACTLIYSFVDHPEINKVLMKLDTKASIKTVETLIENININKINKTVCVVLNHLHQILCEITDNLSKITYSLNNHKKKWFKRFRKADYSIYLDKLENNHKILEKRLKNLFEILAIKDILDSKNNNFLSKLNNF